MGGKLTAWRRFGAAFAALVLAVLALGPSLESALCADEAPAEATAFLLASDAGHADDHGRADGCVHGHCHHGAPYAPEPATSAAPTLAYAAARLTPGGDAAPPAGRQFDLIRPPRA
jgi:hypothetical protein